MKKILLILALLAFVPARGGATELVVNGGFETGDLTGWTSDGVVWVRGEGTFLSWGVTPYSGEYMAVLSPLGTLDAGIGQDVDFTGYDYATVSFAYKLGAVDWTPIVDLGHDAFKVYLGGNLIYDAPIDPNFATLGTTPWITVSQVVPTALLGESLSFIFWNENWGSGDETQNTVAFVDNVSANATVPDLSSTLLLLGMGLSGLAGAARLRPRK